MTTLSASADEREAALYRLLRELGIAWRTVAHVPVFTVEEARAARGATAGGHTKNLFVKDKRGNLWLMVVREELRIDLNALAKEVGASRFSFGSEMLLAETLGVPAGSVTPFALMNDAAANVRVVLDSGLMKLDPLCFHPLRNDRTTAIATADLMRFLRGTGHEPDVREMPERAS